MVLPPVVRTLAALAAVLILTPAAIAAAPAATATNGGEKALGNPRAKVTAIEYASVTCPHCGRFNNDVLPAFKAKYVDTGKVYYIFREFPTDPAQLSGAGFLVARCAPPDKYFAVLDALFHGQEKLYQSQDGKAFILDAAKVGGMDEAKVQACIENQANQDAFNSRVQAAYETAKIHATPTFLIGRTRVEDKTRLEGEQTLDQLSAAIDPLLAAK